MNLRKFAQGKECQIRAYGVCNGDNNTVIWAHVRKGGVGGMGMKPPDLCGVLACSSCHDLLDGRLKTEYTVIQIEAMALHGMCRTMAMVSKTHELVEKK